MFFNNKFNIVFGLNLTLVYTFPMCMAWRFHFPIRNYDFKALPHVTISSPISSTMVFNVAKIASARASSTISLTKSLRVAGHGV